MKRETAYRLAQEISRLADDLKKEFAMELRSDRAKMKTFRAGTSGAPEYEYNPPRNWNDTIGAALPTEVASEAKVGFIGVLWADVFRTHVGRAPSRKHPLVDSFMKRHRATLAAWERRGLIDHEST